MWVLQRRVRVAATFCFADGMACYAPHDGVQVLIAYGMACSFSRPSPYRRHGLQLKQVLLYRRHGLQFWFLLIWWHDFKLSTWSDCDIGRAPPSSTCCGTAVELLGKVLLCRRHGFRTSRSRTAQPSFALQTAWHQYKFLSADGVACFTRQTDAVQVLLYKRHGLQFEQTLLHKRSIAQPSFALQTAWLQYEPFSSADGMANTIKHCFTNGVACC